MAFYLIVYTDNRSTWSEETEDFFYHGLLENVFHPKYRSQEAVNAQMERVLAIT